MKRWVLFTVLLYLICISVLTMPLFQWLGEGWIGWGNESDFYIWFFGVLVAIQLALLLIPMDVIHERPVKRRKVIIAVILGAIPMAFLALLFVYSFALMVWGETGVANYTQTWMTYSFLALSWLVWGFVFHRSYSSENPNVFTAYITSWLLRGSILEMLVAIPSHIISRHRNECCAPPITLIGIAAGLAVALMSFGPGLLFLFARRIKSKKWKQ